jgi:putative endonuclease
MLRCRDGSLYAGITNDLDRRLKAHGAANGARYTRSRLPVTLVYQEGAEDRSAALRREAAVKNLTRVEKLALIAAPRARPPEGPTPAKRAARSALSRTSGKA